MKENDGWISMETLLKFKRLADLSTEPKEILAALAKSDSGGRNKRGEGGRKTTRNNGKKIRANRKNL